MTRATFVRVGRGGLSTILPPRWHPVARWRARQRTKLIARAMFEGVRRDL